jgi:hypothetical protein
MFSLFKKKKQKVIFPCKFLDGSIGTEGLWCKRISSWLYEVWNIPFYTSNIALEDLVKVVEIKGELYYDDLIKTSGNSVIQLLILSNESQVVIGKIFEDLNCNWEGSEQLDYISISIHRKLEYLPIKLILDEGQQIGRWDYKEACLGWK